jgi:hypothetical protein
MSANISPIISLLFSSLLSLYKITAVCLNLTRFYGLSYNKRSAPISFPALICPFHPRLWVSMQEPVKRLEGWAYFEQTAQNRNAEQAHRGWVGLLDGYSSSH